jgi:hypothetical protein
VHQVGWRPKNRLGAEPSPVGKKDGILSSGLKKNDCRSSFEPTTFGWQAAF